MTKRKRFAKALRARLLIDVVFTREQVVTWSMRGHSGPGVYVECTEYPEEGTVFVPLSFGEAMSLAREP